MDFFLFVDLFRYFYFICLFSITLPVFVGGSLTVQIFGSSPRKACEDDEKSETGDRMFVTDKQNGISTSPVVVSSSKDVPGLLKKPRH